MNRPLIKQPRRLVNVNTTTTTTTTTTTPTINTNKVSQKRKKKFLVSQTFAFVWNKIF